MSVSAETAPSRQFHIDNLRNLAVLALILFHSARLFDSEAWHMKNAATYPAADLLIDFMGPWHMPLLFLLAGMSALLALRGRSGGKFAGERFARLFVPLVAGIVLFVAVQVYVERISPSVPNRQSPFDFAGSYFDFLPQFFASCCYEDGNFSWHHLWFLAYLFVYSLILIPVFLWLSRSNAARRLAAWFGESWRPFLVILPLGAIEALLRPAFPSTHALIDDWANHASFIALIVIGGLVAVSPALADGIARNAFRFLVGAILLTVVWLIQPELPAFLASATAEIRAFTRAALGWLWIGAFLGYARLLLEREVPFLTGFTRYALPFYIIHQAVIVWLGWLLFGWSGMPLVKFAAIVLVSGVASYGLARLADLTPVSRFLLGMKTARRRQTTREMATA